MTDGQAYNDRGEGEDERETDRMKERDGKRGGGQKQTTGLTKKISFNEFVP